MATKMCLSTKDGFKLLLTDEMFEELVGGDEDNMTFVNGMLTDQFNCKKFYFGQKVYDDELATAVLMARGYPCVKDVLPELFACLMVYHAPYAGIIRKFLYSIPREEFIDGFERAVKYLEFQVNLLYPRLYLNCLIDMKIMRSEFKDPMLWDRLKERIAGETADNSEFSKNTYLKYMMSAER